MEGCLHGMNVEEKELAAGAVWKDWITRTWKNRRFKHVKKAKKRRKKNNYKHLGKL